jgi:hypothetical protein
MFLLSRRNCSRAHVLCRQRELSEVKNGSAATSSSGGSLTLGAGASSDARVNEAEAAQREAEADAAKRVKESEELQDQVSKLEQVRCPPHPLSFLLAV